MDLIVGNIAFSNNVFILITHFNLQILKRNFNIKTNNDEKPFFNRHHPNLGQRATMATLGHWSMADVL